ncbi:putative RNA recognition motif domain, nucleotide-binding alpha-beta plait domain superfamily [Plasmopara halstedii]
MEDEEQTLMATEDACRVYVGNLCPKAKEAHIASKFSQFGTIHSVWIARRPPGFAFVRFECPDAAQRAVSACQETRAMIIFGKAVRVEMAGEKDRKLSTDTTIQQVKNRKTLVNMMHQRTSECKYDLTSKSSDLKWIERSRNSRSRYLRRGSSSKEEINQSRNSETRTQRVRSSRCRERLKRPSRLLSRSRSDSKRRSRLRFERQTARVVSQSKS